MAKKEKKEVVEVEFKELSPKETKQVQVLAQEIATKPQLKLNREQIDLLKRTVAVGASDDELSMFLNICRATDLSPFIHQVHFVPFWDSKTSTERRAIIIGIDGYRSIAESSGKYAGNDDAVFDGESVVEIDKWENKKVVGKEKLSVPNKATVSVYKIMEGHRFPFTATARWSEYYPGGKKGMQWHKMPFTMLGKCAEALALRKAFPKLLSGTYETSEMSRTVESGDQDKRQTTAFEKLMLASKKMSVEELNEYKGKIEKSDKYTMAQKNQFKKFADGRIEELGTDKKQ